MITTNVERARRVHQFCHVVGLTNRTLLSQDRGRVEATNGDQVAFNDGNTIFIGFNHPCVFIAGAQNGNQSQTVYLIGVNYHELAHLMFTPAIGSSLRLEVKNSKVPNMAAAWNILEDGRIEKLLTSMYAATLPFLQHTLITVVGYVYRNQDAFSAYAVAAPRANYLPPDLLRRLRRGIQHVPKSDLDRMQQIADDFRDLYQSSSAIQLVEQYARLLNKYALQPNEADMHGGKAGVSPGSPAVDPEQQRQLTQASKGEEAKPFQGQSQAGQQGQPGTDAGQPSSDSQEQPGGQEKASGKNAERQEPADGGQQAGTGTDQGKFPNDIHGLVQKALRDLVQSTAVQEELRQHNAAMRKRDTQYRSWLPPHDFISSTPTADMQTVSRKMTAALQRLSGQFDPGWDRRKSSGKLNVQRWLQEADLEEAFDSWREDRSDAGSLMSVMLIDVSSSMGTQNKYVDAACTAWIVRRAVESLPRVQSYGFAFNGTAFQLWDNQAKNRAKPNIVPVWSAGGGTKVSDLLDEAAIVFSTSTASNKLLTVFSDGEFERDIDSDLNKKVLGLTEAGVVSSHFMIGHSGTRYFNHTAQIGVAQDALPLINKTVQTLLKQSLRRR